MIYLYNVTNSQTYSDLEEFLESIADDAGTTYLVMFLVNLTDLFEAVKKKTALRGRFAKGQQGEPLLDNIAITDDERDFFDDTIKRGAPEVFRKLSAWAKGIDQAYRHDVTFGEGTEKYIIYTVTMNLNWDLNMLQGVDNAIREALICYVVKTWYYLNRYVQDYEAEEGEYQVELNRVRSQLLHTKVPVRRPTDMFSDSSSIIAVHATIPVSDGTPSSSGVRFYEFTTGALAAGVLKSVAHNQNMTTGYSITVRDNLNNVEVGVLRKTPGDEANSIDIQVSVNIADPGLTVQIIGS